MGAGVKVCEKTSRTKAGRINQRHLTHFNNHLSQLCQAWPENLCGVKIRPKKKGRGVAC